MGEGSPQPSVSGDPEEQEFIVISERPRHLRSYLSSRRRHRSAQDTRTRQDRRRHCSAQEKQQSSEDDNEVIRQRCFSFNALKDAFKRSSQQNLPECESLLTQDNDNNSVFSSQEVLSSPGPPSVSCTSSTTVPLTILTTSVITTTTRIQRRPPQQVSFVDRILEDSESSSAENVDQQQRSHILEARLRQRHCSAPGDSSKAVESKCRHRSGNT